MKQTQVIALVLVALVLGLVIGIKVGKSQPVAAGPTASTDTALPRLVDLGSVGCIPCKRMAPILEELKTEYAGKVSVEFIDVNVNPAAADEYRISLIPTQVFFDKDGKEVFRHEGFFPKEDILAQFEKMGIKTQ